MNRNLYSIFSTPHVALMLLVALLTFNFQMVRVCAQTTEFTYQGRVADGGTNFTGSGQFKFALVTSTNFNHQATATANPPSGGFITIINVDFGGNGYMTPPAVTILGGGGSDATAHATLAGGMVTGITVDNPGQHYSTTPTVMVDPPVPDIVYTTYWSNDGTSLNGGEPSAAVDVAVRNGLFTVALGDTTQANMTAIDASVFGQPNLQLRIWFNDGVNGSAVLNPSQNLTPVPYAVVANNAGSANRLLGTLPASQLTGTLPASQVGGTLTLAQLPGSVLTNNQSGVSLTGTFSGNGAGVTNVSIGSLSLTGTLTNHAVFAWGNNSFGQLNVPGTLTNAVAVAVGYSSSLALKSDGTVVAWGNSSNGQTNIPAGLNNVVAVAAGGYHNLALRNDGTVVAWGSNNTGQTNVPPGLANVAAVAAGTYHSLALKNDRTVVAWGYNSTGETNVPVGLTNAVAVAAGSYFSLALKSDGTVLAWGDNSYGQTNVPAGLSNVVAVAAGGYHALALKNDRTVVAWGYNNAGQANIPAGLTNAVAVAAGSYFSLALKSDGSVVAWGDNTYGQTNIPSGLRGIIGLAPGPTASHILVIQGQSVTPANWPTAFDRTTTFNASTTVNGDLRVTGLLRSGSEAGTSQPPNPAGLVFRRIDSTAMTSNAVVALMQNVGSTGAVTLVRDGTAGGFQIQIPASPGYINVAAMGVDNTGTPRDFFTNVTSGPMTIQLYTAAQNIVHFECTFGDTFSGGKSLTQVTLSRFSSDFFWSGFLVSSSNQ